MNYQQTCYIVIYIVIEIWNYLYQDRRFWPYRPALAHLSCFILDFILFLFSYFMGHAFFSLIFFFFVVMMSLVQCSNTEKYPSAFKYIIGEICPISPTLLVLTSRVLVDEVPPVWPRTKPHFFAKPRKSRCWLTSELTKHHKAFSL